MSFSDLADITLLVAFSAPDPLLSTTPAPRIIAHNVIFLILIQHTRNFRHNPKLA